MMKKITPLILILLGSFWSYSQCLTSVNGQWPGPTGTPFALNTSNCDGFTVQNVINCGYASEYSLVTVALGQTYVFKSSIATDVITISTDAGATAAAFGIGTVTWVSTVSGNIRFYTHLDATCAAQSTCRIKSITCGIVSPDAPDYANLQFPATATIVQGGNVTVYGQVYEGGLTDVTPNIVGQAPGIQVWLGTNTTNTNPNTWTNWTVATWNAGHVSNNDEYQATIGANLAPGTYYYATRIRLNSGAYFYGGINASPPNNGNFWNGETFGSGVLTVTPAPPPANDDCSGALPLTVNPDYFCGSVTAGTVLGATASTTDATACFGTEDDDVWFSFVATSTAHRISILNAAGSTTDMYHSLWTGADCSSLTLVAGSCSDADISNPTGLTIGTTYYVRVYTWTATAGQNSTFNVCIGTQPPPPTNDDCSGAITVTCGSTTTGTTESTTNENQAVCGISGVTTQNSPGVWYKFVGNGSDVTVTTCSPTITTGDSRIAVYSGTCGSLTCIGGNDDALVAGCATNTLSSIVTFSTVVGTDYYILVYSYTFTPGTNPINFQLNVSCVAPCSPTTSNDECSAATQVTIGTPITGTNNSCSSASLGITYPSCGNLFGTYYDTWYSFDSDSVTDVTIALTNQTGTSGFVVYSGTCGALTQVTGSCSTTGASTNVSGLTPGTYYLRVFSVSPAARGSYDLSVTGTLGTGSFDNGSFSYYPNPVRNTLNLSYNQEISNVEIFNLLGQRVNSNNINTNEAQVDMSNLSNGVYLVKVTSNNQEKTIRVIKE